MAELQYKLMTSAVNNFDCGNSAINEYVENSYFATLLQQCYAYEIEYKSLVVGYYMITFRDVAFMIVFQKYLIIKLMILENFFPVCI